MIKGEETKSVPITKAVNKNRAGNLELAIGSYKEPSGSIPVPVGIIGGFAGGL